MRYAARCSIDPANPNVIYAGVEGDNSEPRGFQELFKSTDGGATWWAITNGLDTLLDSRCRMTTLVIEPSNSDVLYAGTSGTGVFKSSDGGANWTSLNDGLGNLDVRVLSMSKRDASSVLAGTSEGVFKLDATGAQQLVN